MALYTEPYDTADYLKDDQTIIYYLEDALEEGNPREIARSLRTAVRAKGGVEKVAAESGISLESLQQALADENGASQASLFTVLRALRLKVKLGSTLLEPIAA